MRNFATIGQELKNSKFLKVADASELEKYNLKLRNNLRPLGDMAAWVQKNYEFRHNLMLETYEYRSKEDQDDIFRTVDKNFINSLNLELQLLGICVKPASILQLIESMFAVDFHPTKDYIDKMRGKWDGVDRLDSFCSRINRSGYCKKMLHIWMRSMVAQMMGIDQSYANSVMFILVSPKQGLHKSTFMKKLLPDELQEYYTDDFSLNQKALALRKTVEFAIVNDDEMDKENPKKAAFMKTLLQCNRPSFRGAYRKHINKLPRVASFVGTSNTRELLVDKTGSRRFLILEPEGMINVEGINYEQIYAQLIDEIDKGMATYFSNDDEKELQEHNLPYYVKSDVEKLIEKFYREPAENVEAQPVVEVNAKEMMTNLARHNAKLIRETSLCTFSKTLKSMFGNPIHTKLGNVYRLVML